MIPESGRRRLRHLDGLDPVKLAELEAACAAREAQRRARAAPPPPPEKAAEATEAREWAEAVAEGFRHLASRLRALAASEGVDLPEGGHHEHP
jgi:hypothetical protein